MEQHVMNHRSGRMLRASPFAHTHVHPTPVRPALPARQSDRKQPHLRTARHQRLGHWLAGAVALMAVAACSTPAPWTPRTPACAAAAPASAAPLPPLQALAPQVWWLPGAPGDSDGANRGLISNLLIVADDERLWLVGSGPSAVQGRALAQQLGCQLGRVPTDVISPWPRPELVLGQAGMPSAHSWAHADVAAAMAQRCSHCVERLRARLGRQAGDLDGHTIRLPDRLLQGDHGRLGPFMWWRLARGGDTPVTVWWHPASGIFTAHGLLWTDGAPDLRDTDIAAMQAATQQLQTLQSELGPNLRWLPEQGPIASAWAAAEHLRYWAALAAAVTQAQAEGRSETDAAAELPGIDRSLNASARHALNWQRAWRQAEASGFGAPR
jgi:hypothetical protein